MGVVWILTEGGKIIHLPVVGDNVNCSAEPILLPEVGGYGFDENLGVRTQDHDFIIEFAPNGRTGKCKMCGLCCTHPGAHCPNPAGKCGYRTGRRGLHFCEYLSIEAGRVLGDAGAARCSVWTGILSKFKGCALWPENNDEIQPHCKGVCGFRFKGK